MQPKTNSDKPHYRGHRRRIKDRFIKNGLSTFCDYEVLELLLTFAISQKDVKPMAKSLLSRFTTFQEVLEAPIAELQTIEGIGGHTATLLKLVRDCSEYYLRCKLLSRDVIASPDDLYKYCQCSMAYRGDEQFRIIHLNAKNQVVNEEIVYEGTVNQTAVYPRKIMQRALLEKSVALIFVHNHPSGDPQPSSHDRDLTGTLIQAARTLGITVHDHIIIARGCYFSFREHGML
jgi:DNA repair protein RadC